ncbi:MAG: hypothetical protein AW09_001126 [Candidatus Accumulibacter phosphatis]|uniref:Uncharacterized protein n=1 Tax=Candidatus Accumulibacter phosphatis TaxID=327160 RepID=A0A080LY32_9PROT|nr:MAG: hypothetical protein AW09_001126 [Candidatus Accumulibacter phosphatis]
MAKRRQRALCKLDSSWGGGTLLQFDGLQQRLQCFGKLGHTIQADDRQGALHLVQMGAAEPDLRAVAAPIGSARGELLQCRVASFEGEVDLALDPGQRADIEVRRSIHLSFRTP